MCIVGITEYVHWYAGKTLKQQAEALASSHIYILIHGAAMALYMFLPKHAAIIEVQSAIMITFAMLFINVHDDFSLLLSACLVQLCPSTVGKICPLRHTCVQHKHDDLRDVLHG
jgi:hypothetical protein